jgi:putative inorganic carbon (HCO3(-)) transporter
MATRRASADPEQKTRYLYWWLLLALVFEYVRPGVHFPPLAAIPLNSTIPLSLFLVSLFAKGLRPWNEIARDPFARWMLAYMLFILFSMAYADNKSRTLSTFNSSLGYFFMFVMIVRIATTAERVRGIFATLVLCHLFLLAMNTQLLLDPSVRHYVKGAPFMGDGNDYSLSLCLLVPFVIDIALSSKSTFKRILWWGAVLLLVLGIVGTQSRGATLAIAAVFGYMWLQSSHKAISMVAILLVGAIAVAFAPDVYFDRLNTITTYQEESSAQSRIQAWKAGTQMALHNPLGVGSGNFPNNFPKYRGPDAPVRWMTAHSMYFLILGELGFLGLALLMHLVFGNIRLNTKLRRVLAEQPVSGENEEHRRTLYAISTAFVGFAVAGAFLSVAYYPHIFVLNGLALAYRAVVVNKSGVTLFTPKPAPKRGRGAAWRSSGRTREQTQSL